MHWRAGSLGWQAYARFSGWVVVSVLAYVLYGMHRAEAKDARDSHMCAAASAPSRAPDCSRSWEFYPFSAWHS